MKTSDESITLGSTQYIKMAAVFDRNAQAASLQNDSILLLHCITSTRKEIAVESFNVLGLRLRVAHVSFPASIGERFMVLVPDQSDGEPARLTLDPPQLISVKTSCELRVSFTFS